MNDADRRELMREIAREMLKEVSAQLVAQAVDHVEAMVRPDKGRDGDAKLSKCCLGAVLVPLHSTNTKICTSCHVEYVWPLEPGQKPTFTKELKP